MSHTDNVEQIDRHITKRYQIIEKIGKGAYGFVWTAIDKVTHQVVSLKKIFGAFKNETDAQRTFREISFLKQMDGNPQIIQLLGVYKSINNCLDLYVVLEVLESDVHSVIRANILMDIHKRYIVWQILAGLKYLHSRNLIHCNLNPSNILINSDSTVKLCDFGLSRTLTESNICQNVIPTNWYSSPELIVGSNYYNEGVDMWSVGCIVAELYANKPLFQGTSKLDQLESIVAFTGHPNSTDINSMHSEFAETMIANLHYNQPRFTLKQILPTADDDTIDFIQKLLVFNPEKRMKVNEALEHSFVAKFHNPEKELTCDVPIKLSLDDNKKYSVKDYRNKIYKNFLSKLPDKPINPLENINQLTTDERLLYEQLSFISIYV